MTVAPKVLALVPHQDDELLIMGPAIRNAVRSGREVHVVLHGLGDGTVVRTRDMPRLLGYLPTSDEIGAVRDREFYASAAVLGVDFARVKMADPRQPEKNFSLDVTKAIATSLAGQMPDAEVWVVSQFDANPDHSIMGLAVQDLVNEGAIAQARGFVAPWCRNEFPHPPLTSEQADIGYREQAPYRYTDIAAGQWGVGLKSVRKYFDAQLDEPVSWSYPLRPAG